MFDYTAIADQLRIIDVSVHRDTPIISWIYHHESDYI